MCMWVMTQCAQGGECASSRLLQEAGVYHVLFFGGLLASVCLGCLWGLIGCVVVGICWYSG